MRKWSSPEKLIIENSWGILDASELRSLLPNRTWNAIDLQARSMKLGPGHYARETGHKRVNWKKVCNEHRPRIVLAAPVVIEKVWS